LVPAVVLAFVESIGRTSVGETPVFQLTWAFLAFGLFVMLDNVPLTNSIGQTNVLEVGLCVWDGFALPPFELAHLSDSHRLCYRLAVDQQAFVA
jgi:hypothetical protein